MGRQAPLVVGASPGLCKTVRVTRFRSTRRGERGGAAVEFALVLPVFVAVLFGMVDYGWYFYQKFTLASAIREGVRLGSTYKEGGTAGDPYAKALAEAKDKCDQGSVPQGSVTWSGGYADLAPVRKIWLQGVYTFHPLVGLVPMPNSSMSYKMTMLLEQQY
jgi:Flp pilus assembly pilin Flp